MKRRISYIVLVGQPANLKIAELQYFLLHHNTNKALAVVKHIPINAHKQLVHPSVHHLVNIDEPVAELTMYMASDVRESCCILMEMRQ